jgi:hypothetical protein
MTMRTVLLIAAGLLSLSATACGDSTPVTGSPAPVSTPTPALSSGAPQATSVCNLLSQDQVTSLFGVTAGNEPSRNPARECMWTANRTHQLHVQVYQGRNHYSAAAWGGTPEPVAGLADEAFVVRKAGLGATVGFRKANTTVFLNYQILLTRDANPGAKADTLIALAQTISTQT